MEYAGKIILIYKYVLKRPDFNKVSIINYVTKSTVGNH